MLIALFRTFLVFFVGGLLMTTAVISLFLIGGIVWLDCIHDNPNHTGGDALFFVAVSPFYGIIIGMVVNFLPVIVGAALAVLGRAAFGYVPLWYVMAILAACVLAYNAQGSPWLPYDELRPLSQRLLVFSAFQVSALLICWWWDRRDTWT
jgi:putative flippase GtrA